jgi:predicted phage tail protein
VTTHYTETGLPDPAPATPTGLSALVSPGRIDLHFADNASNEFFVDVERCTGSGCTGFAKIGQTLGEDATGFRDSAVEPGATYTYRLRAVGFAGSSAYSATLIVAPQGSPSPPLAPGDLAGEALNTSQIRLTWTNNSANQDLVKIERCLGLACTNFTQIAGVAGTAITYTDSGLARNTTYRYRVRAHNPVGDSPYSNTATARTPRR